MSKAFAYATSMGGEVYFTKASDKNTVDWFDDQGHVNMPLFTTDHAEELAAVLTKILHGAPLEYLHPDNVKAASLALNKYREATE